MSNIHNVYISLNYDLRTQSKGKPWITLCMLGNFSYILSSVIFFKIEFLLGHHQSGKQHEFRSGPDLFWPYVVPNCMQR